MLICRTVPRTLLIRRLLWGGVVLGLAVYAGLTIWLAHSALFFPFQLDYGEGIVLWFTRELALGHSIYKGLEGLPYASSNYPPLGMALAVPFRFLFGDTYIGGRWLNFAAALITSAFIFRIVVEVSGKQAAAASALFFFGSTFVYHWVPLFRVDLIGLTLTVAGIYVVRRWEREYAKSIGRGHVLRGGPGTVGTGALGLAALLFLAALLCKHSLVFAPAAAFAALFLRDRRAAVGFGLALVLATAIIFLIANAITQGGFYFGLVTSNATVWLWSTFQSLVNSFLWTYLVLVALALWGWFVRVRGRRIGVLEIYAVLAAASILLAGRVGAWENYYFELIFAVCVFAGFALSPLLNGKITEGPLWLAGLLLVQLGLFWPQHDPAIAMELMNNITAGNQQVGPLVHGQQGIVISEDMGMLVTNGKPVDYYTFQYSSLARSGQWDQHWEIGNLRSGGFPLVILNQGTREDVDHFRDFTREFLSALDYGYAMSLENARYKVYAPAPLAHLAVGDWRKVELVGWSLDPDSNPRLGQMLSLVVVWRAKEQMNTRYTAFAHLEDSGGGVVAQDDHEPRVGIFPSLQPYPTTRWAANEMMRDKYTLAIPSALTPGSYSLRLGWYDSVTQDRLTLGDGEDFLELTRLEIR